MIGQLGENMRKMIYGALFGILLIFVLTIGARANGAPILTYVYSNSMEPFIKVNDAFIVWPEHKLTVGDIIMFRPVVLEATFVTHRIVAIGDNGFITKGDNTPYQDQESGEPEVTSDRIVGRVVTIQGQPLIFPGFGKISEYVQATLGQNARSISFLFFMLGILSLLLKSKYSVRRRKSRRRLRLRHIYHAITVSSVLLIILSVSFGSRVNQVRYLVSEYPGTLGDQVEVSQNGTLTMKIKNHGLVPAWTMVRGIDPLSVGEAPKIVKPRSEEIVTINVRPQLKTGIYYGYLQVYLYPVLLPRKIMIYLHGIHPVLAVITTGLVFGLYITLCLRILKHIPGFDEWIPLSAIQDKLSNRRFQRARAKYLGRRRIR